MWRSEIVVLVLAWLGLVAAEMPTHVFKNGDKMPLLGLGVSCCFASVCGDEDFASLISFGSFNPCLT